jgi:hypothetical protein
MNANANLNEKEVVMEVKEGGSRQRSRRRRKGAAATGVVEATMVTKAEAVPKPVVPSVVTVSKKPVVILAPPKKKVPKVMLVPKSKSAPTVNLKKTFRAKRVAVTINNTAKTQKQHRGIVENVDAMTDDQVRAAACAAKLSRRETVGKAPITLLRQMIKDYQLMKKMLN